MKLWHISQDVNNGYDTYDSAVVAAEDEAAARLTHPLGRSLKDYGWAYPGLEDGGWASEEHIKCRYIGEAATDIKAGVICASFNAG